MNCINRIALIVIVVICSCINKADEKKSDGPLLENDLYKIQLTTLAGQPLNLKQYQGKAVFINFWATWCKPCIEEMPYIMRMQRTLRHENLIFLFASNESIPEIENFKNEHNFNFNYVRMENAEASNIQALPTTFIFNPQGHLVFSENGFQKWDDSNHIKMILKIIK